MSDVSTSSGSVDAASADDGKTTILVVEDDPSQQRATRRVLERDGFAVLLAENGEQALDVYRQNREDVALVVSDLTMERLSGQELVRVLRDDGDLIAVLLTSGHTSATSLSEIADAVNVAFIQKPWTISDFLLRVHELLAEA